jgi:PEGA domain
MDAHQRIRDAELRDLKIVWAPASIIFSDGTRIGEGSGTDHNGTADAKPPTQNSRSGSRQDEAAPTGPVRNAGTVKSILISFTSSPADAEVNVDGEYWGSTPITNLTRLSAGPHTIVVKKVGYQPWERKITLALGDDRTISAELQANPSDGNKPRISGN